MPQSIDLASHQILVHGVNKSDEDLAAAVEHGGVLAARRAPVQRSREKMRERSQSGTTTMAP